MKPVLVPLFALVAASLSSCGSGGSGETPITFPPPPIGGVSTMSAAQLRNCPLGNFKTTGSLPSGVGECVRGVVSGVTELNGSNPCTVEYNGSTVSYRSAAFNMDLALQPTGKAEFQHTTSNGQHMVNDSRNQYDANTKDLNYTRFQYSQYLDVAVANVIIEVSNGNQRGSCYAKL